MSSTLCPRAPLLILCVWALYIGASAAQVMAGSWLSPDGKYLVIPDQRHQRFTVHALETTESVEVSGTLTGGRLAQWSPDGSLVGFKVVRETATGARLQAPALLDVASAEVILLHRPVPLAGNPAFSANGRIAYTIGTTLILVDEELQRVATATLPHYVNWIALAPDASSVLYIDPADRVVRYTWHDEVHQVLTPEQQPSCRPSFSPDGSAVLASTIGGELSRIELASGAQQMLGPGDHSAWLQDGTAVLASQRVYEHDRLTGIRLVRYGRDGSVRALRTDPELWPRRPLPSQDDSGQLYFVDEKTGQLYRATLGQDRVSNGRPLHLPAPTRQITVPVAAFLEAAAHGNAPQALQWIRDVPYHHQVYDTPGWFDGGGACGATSATMAIQFYSTLPDWDFLAASPFTHTSHFGAYVAEIYAFNGYTYNILAEGGYGGHGHIWQDNGLGTKENMRSYIAQHSLASPAVDWTPSFAELQAEVAAHTPFVLLSSITTSGHYKTVIGFHEGQHTVYFNDPYGDKNEGYMNYNGAGTSYDWPGYNNGYENLNTVWCYIYARGTPPAEQPGTIDDPIVIPGFPYTNVNTTRSSGGTDVFDAYSCAPSVDEQGREKTYTFTVETSGELSVDVACDNEVDIDIHLLTAPDASSCLRRAHISFSQWIAAGTYWLVCDTYRDSGTDLMGDYTLSCSFTPDCSYSISPAVQSFIASGGSGVVSVSAASGCSWTAASNASWLTISSGSSGSGSGQVGLSVAANDGAFRTGTLTVTEQTVLVTQDGVGGGGVSGFSSFAPVTGATAQLHCLAADTSGAVYVLAPLMDDSALTVVRSSDGGASWGPPTSIPDSAPMSSYADMVVDLTDTMHVVWMQGTDVSYSQSTDGAVSFSTPVTVRTGALYNGYRTVNGSYPVVASDGGGNLSIAYSSATVSSSGSFIGHNVWISRSMDGGASFLPEVFAKVPNASQEAPVAIELVGGETYLLISNETNDSLSFSRSPGGTFAAVSPPGSLLSNGAGMAVEPDGDTIHVVYASTVTDPAGDIQYSRSDDGGSSWSNGPLVNDNATNGQYNPELRRDGYGTLHVVWTDQRSGSHTYYASSTDGGVSFSANIDISADQPGSSYDQPHIAVDNAGRTAYVSSSRDLGQVVLAHGSFDLFSDGFESGSTAAWSVTVQ